MTQTETPRQFFSTLDLNKLPAEAADAIRTQLLTDARLDLPVAETDEYKILMESIKQNFPEAVGTSALEAKAEEKQEVKTTEKPSKQVLQTRLKNLNKMSAKNPGDKTLATRIKNLEKMISKLK